MFSEMIEQNYTQDLSSLEMYDLLTKEVCFLQIF